MSPAEGEGEPNRARQLTGRAHSATIITDTKKYGAIGAIFITTWLISIGALIILGAAAGAVWEDRKS